MKNIKSKKEKAVRLEVFFDNNKKDQKKNSDTKISVSEIKMRERSDRCCPYECIGGPRER